MAEQAAHTMAYTDREIWEFGTFSGFPEDPEMSILSHCAWEVYCEVVAVEEEEARLLAIRMEEELLAEELRQQELLAQQIQAEKEAEAAAALEDVTDEPTEPSVPEPLEESGEPAEPAEPDSVEMELSATEPEGSELAEATAPPEPVQVPHTPTRLENDLLQDPSMMAVYQHATAAAMYPHNVIRMFAEINGKELRFRSVQPIQGGPGSAYGVFVSVGADGNLVSAEGPESLRAIALELAGVTATSGMRAYPVSPLAQMLLIAASDIALESGDLAVRFTLSAVMNAFSLARDQDYARLCAPVIDVFHEKIRSFIVLEDVMQALEALASLGIFTKEMNGDRAQYSFAEAYRKLPELFSGSDRRFAISRHDIEGNGNLLYVLTKDEDSWAFVMDGKGGRIEKMDQDSLKKVMRDIFPLALFCTNCGAPLAPGAKFCEQCGAKVD